MAAAILTPEAEQAAVQPPMDPAMAGAAPMPPQGAPADPAMMGGAPAEAQMPGMPTGATGPRGGEIPPEILQDQMFLQFLMEAMGVVFDPNNGMFVDPNGQPVPVEVIIQAYQEFQATLQQQGGMPQPGAPMDPTMMGGAPMDPTAAPEGAVPEGAPLPEAGQEQAMQQPGIEMPPEVQQAAAPEGVEQIDPINEISGAVMSGVEAILQDFTATLEKKLSALLERVEGLSKAVDALQSTTDRREQSEKDADAQLREEIAADLMPTSATKQAATQQPINLFELIQGNK